MAKMHSRGRGQSSSMKPFATTVPTYMTGTITEIKSTIIALAKKNQPPAKIGAILRDQHGVGKVSDILGCNLLDFLKENSCAPVIPEQIANLMDRANNLIKHLRIYKKDNDAKHRFGNIVSKIHRISRYYRRRNELPSNWKPTFLSI